MTGLEIGLIIVVLIMLVMILVLGLALIVVATFAWRYGSMILAWEENIDEALDVLDDAHAKLNKISNMPLFVNTPEVQNAMHELQRCKDVVLYVANMLTLPAGKDALQR